MTVIFRRAFSPLSATLRILAAAGAAACLTASEAAVELSLSLSRLEAPGVSAAEIQLRLIEGAPATLQIAIGEMSLQGRGFRNVRASCTDFSWTPTRIECRKGSADFGTRVPLSFVYSVSQESLELALRPSSAEAWMVHAQFSDRAPSLRLNIENGALARLAVLLPADWPKLTSGVIDGVINIDGRTYDHLSARLSVREAAFSDPGGTQAAEKLGAAVELTAQRKDKTWSYRAKVDWQAGEIYWQPLYLKAMGQSVSAAGTVDDTSIAVKEGDLRLGTVGEIRATGQWDRQKNQLVSADLESGLLDVSNLYSQLLKPFFFGTALGELRADGKADLSAQWRSGGLEAITVTLNNVSFEDANRRFAIFGAQGRIPWHRSKETAIDLEMKGGELLRVPFGQVRLPLSMRGMRFRLDTVALPLLDGTLTMRGFATEPPQEGWRWAFRGGLSPVSMARFTEAVGLPTMHGTISAEIPRVTYSRSTLRVDGALLVKVFDGTVTVSNLALIEPFGKVPRVALDLEARRIDLDLLTRALSFGSITGRIDATVKNLELANWRPVKFDARIESSEGDYRRKISQRAVQNITSLGGASAAAAIQGSFLRFFSEFGYQRLGLSCRLERGVCMMGGIEDVPGAYVIIKGGGIPALSVMGYNRAVDWNELVDRLKRVIQNNVQMIVQ